MSGVMLSSLKIINLVICLCSSKLKTVVREISIFTIMSLINCGRDFLLLHQKVDFSGDLSEIYLPMPS